MDKPKAPDLVFVPTPCPGCGATTELEAETMCKPMSDETGERFCNGEFKDGISVQPTPESLKALDNFFCALMCSI